MLLPKEMEILLQDSNKKYDLADSERFISTSNRHNGDKVIVDFLNWIFFEATAQRASDVHFTDQENGCMVKIRDKYLQLQNIVLLSRLVSQTIDTHIRAKSKISSSDRESPLDGSFWLLSEDQNTMIDVRVSIVPTRFGQNIVCRILDNSNSGRKLDSIYMSDEIKKIIIKVLNLSQGMILVSGPTGSGKTSTLYSFLNYLNKPNIHIITAEDPVEYRIKGINQVNIHTKNRSFAKVLRAFLRQDPDIILIGEIRDTESAKIATTAANTGHLVLSSIHTRDAVSTIYRLCDLGVEKYAIADAITAFFAQRLVNKLCSNCCIEQKIKEYKGTTRFINKIYHKRNVSGCSECNFTGISGKIPIIEFATVDKEVKNCILNNQIHLLENILKKQKSYRTLTESALEMSAKKLVDFETAKNIKDFYE